MIAATSRQNPLDGSAFGDQISLFTGSTEFVVNDIEVKGNSGLPVTLGRRFIVRDKEGSVGDLTPFAIQGFHDWDIEIPYISGTFDKMEGWVVGNSSDPHRLKRCSTVRRPFVGALDTVVWNKVWMGYDLHIPGMGEEKLLSAMPGAYGSPNDGQSYPWVTKSNIRLRCLNSTENGYPGEAFVAITPSGTKYFFNWAIERSAAPINDGSTLSHNPTRQRKLVFLLATRIEDRFGNFVNYEFSGNKVTSIVSSDGRSITLNYAGEKIVTATSSGRVWRYDYNSTTGDLLEVKLPDGSSWRYEKNGNLKEFRVNYVAVNNPDIYDVCDPPPGFWNGPFTYTITHPSGAKASYTFDHYRIRRGGDQCYPPPGSYTSFFDTWAISSRTLMGPGLLSQTTNYTIRRPGGSSGWTSTVAHPDGTTDLYLFGTLIERLSGTEIRSNEGLLLKKRTLSSSGAVVNEETIEYQYDPHEQTAYPKRIGGSLHSEHYFEGRIAPKKKSSIARSGMLFSEAVLTFDSFARPISRKKYSETVP
ncbi:hypothetical protein [Luteimonas salinilitoris]|uniref:RHS repeat protein n=1 Tax=Luteimonas salinilitoris TaxID=3237697 RepID=A0ABV4HSB9_9GAMM